MANVKLDWTNPSATDIIEIKIYRADTNLTSDGTYWNPADKTSTASQAAAFADSGVSSPVTSITYSAGAATVTQTGVSGGTYTYGVFASNAVGLGPGTLVAITVS